MAFDSLSALIHMEGHGPFVWTCYGAFFLLLALLVWLSLAERRQVVRAQRVQNDIQASSSAAGNNSGWGRAGEAGFQRIQSSQSESVSKS